MSQELSRFVDMDGALRRLGGSEKIYRTLLQSFLKDATFGQLQDELKGGNLEAAAVCAHTIKGVAGNLSLTALYESSIELEKQLKAGQHDEGFFTAYSQTWDATVQSVNQILASPEGAR